MSEIKPVLLAAHKQDTFRTKSRQRAPAAVLISNALKASPFLRHQTVLRNPAIWQRVGREAVVFFCISAIGLAEIVLRP